MNQVNILSVKQTTLDLANFLSLFFLLLFLLSYKLSLQNNNNFSLVFGLKNQKWKDFGFFSDDNFDEEENVCYQH